MNAVTFQIAEGRRALITGGASGFGAGTAGALSRAGVRVAIADVDSAAASRVAAELGDDVVAFHMDVTDRASVRDGVARAAREIGGLDTLVNSAGISIIRPFLELTEAEWDHVLDVNLKGTFLVSQAALSHLAESGRGRIVNLSSAAGVTGAPFIAPYVASKFAINGLTQSLALEFATDGVRVNAVMPSSTPETGMGRQLIGEKLALGWADSEEELLHSSIEQAFPLGRLGRVEDTVNAILFLVSEGADFITGHALAVDGGSILGPAPPRRGGTMADETSQ